MTCFNCFADQMYDCDGTECSCCSESLQPVRPQNEGDEHVFIHVDDSNMWIEAKKRAALKLKLKCIEDPRLRLDIGKVTDVVANGRNVAWGTLYGSEPPPIDSVWQKIRERGWKVITTERSTITNREKQVDHQMVADITALVSDRSVTKGKIVIVSGDADMIPAIKESIKMKWSTEIWMWEGCISSALKKLADEKPGFVQINTLDSSLEEVTFTNFKFREKDIPKSRSAIIKGIDFAPDEKWQNGLCEKLGWPFQFCMIGPDDLDPTDYVDVILIFGKVKSVDGKGIEHHFDKIFEKLQQEYPWKIVNYPSYRNEYDRSAEICIANKYEALMNVDDQLSVRSDDPSHNDIDDLSGIGEEDDFQLVQRKTRRRRNQQYSAPCEDRSNCKRGLNCKYYHSEDEKKFFRNPDKDKECCFKNNCKYGSSKCRYAHSNKMGYCTKCHEWGHLPTKCQTKNCEN